jgi:uncharacterized DUF497 family protein
MLIVDLFFNDTALAKLAARGLSQEDVEQVRDNRPVVVVNPRPRRKGSRLMIGPTDGGRVLTVVIDPHPYADAGWFVATAWDATPAQLTTYRQRRFST